MVKIRANKIKDCNVGDTIPEYTTWCKKRGDCLYKDKKRKFHGWLNLSHLSKKDKVAQCGWDNGNCNHDTHYGIGGYHNICPIAGINGDYVWPAKLQFSDFKFKNYDITSTSNIKSITVYLEHRMVAINTKTGTKYDNFGPNFHAEKGWAAKIYFTKGDTKVSKTIVCDANPKLSKTKFSSFSCKFTDVSISELLDNGFKLNIEYNHNYNTNPGIIYIRNVYIDVEFDNAKMYLRGSASGKTLYTGNSSTCRNTITHTIKAGYKNDKEDIPPSKAPKILGNKIKYVSLPTGVTASVKSSNDIQKVFEITDTSGIEGEKEITYTINGFPKKQKTLKYTAVKRNLPEYLVTNKYKYNEDFDPNKSYIIFKNGCCSSISIYIDSVDSTPITLNVSNQNSSENLLNTAAIETFHSAVKKLSCGHHALYIKRGDETLAQVQQNKVIINVVPMNFKFHIYTNETQDKQLKFTQDKRDNERKSNIILERIDDEPIETIPKLYVYDETKPNSVREITQVTKKSQISHEIDKYYSGEFFITIKSKDCGVLTVAREKMIIESNHRQYFDSIFTRGEYGTGLEFDYLVAWEGDNVRAPITINSIELFNLPNDIRICSKPTQAGLSQVGLIPLLVKNKTNKEINGIEIELNTLVEDEDGNKVVTTEEWVNSDGIFRDFYSLFHENNITLNDNVEVLNLTEDGDLVDEENVYIRINKINAQDTIEIFLPFRSVNEKKVFLQYLLFEEPLTINNIIDCDSLSDSNNTDIEINVYDSMLTNLEIFGQTDLLRLDHSYECPDECYTTKETDENGSPVQDKETGGITYKITNIDTNDFSYETVKTKIINDPALNPYGYILDGTYYPLIDNQGNRLTPQTSKLRLIQQNGVKPGAIMRNQPIWCTVKFPNDEESMTYYVHTNKNGLAEFFIPIPNTINRSYTINELLESVLFFESKEQNEFNYARYPTNPNVIVALKPEKNNVKIEPGNNFKKYNPGDVAYIPVFLSADLKVKENYFEFIPSLVDNGSSDEITILYEICNIKDNKGTFKTIFQTDHKKLIPNEVSKNIYCGIKTNIDLKTRLETELVELDNLNVLYVNVTNQEKENQDVRIQINLKKYPDNYLGNYSFFDIILDSGDYSIIEEDNEYVITWLIGKMKPFEEEKAIIKIKASDIGLSDIKIQALDYLYDPDNEIELIDSICPKCSEEQEKWRIKGSSWTKIDGEWYKKINNKYQKPIIVQKEDGTYIKQWVDKE